MNQIVLLLQAILKSKHTSIPGAIVFLCAVGGIWFPKYADQLQKTRDFATAYGLLAATQLTKPNPTPPNEKTSTPVPPTGPVAT